MHKDVSEILATEEDIRKRVVTIAEELKRDYEGKEPVFVGILKGSFIFMADILRACEDMACTMDFMAVSSYGRSTTSSGVVKIIKDLSEDIEGKDVILIEDILDSGNTLHYLTGYLNHRKPASIRIVTLLDKPERRTAPIKADYVGFRIPNAFVVGYGLDYDQKYRNLPYIGVLKPEVYS